MYNVDPNTKLCVEKPLLQRILIWLVIFGIIALVVGLMICCCVCTAAKAVNNSTVIHSSSYDDGRYRNYSGLSHNPHAVHNPYPPTYVQTPNPVYVQPVYG